MYKVVAAKQVGTVYYMVRDVDALYKILSKMQINMSSSFERNRDTGRNQTSVSLSRNPDAMYHQNSNKWHIGLMLDGSKLSEKYKFSPYNYAGSVLDNEESTTKLKLKSITAYDDNTYSIVFVGWGPAKPISQYVYEDVKKVILDHVEEHPDRAQKEKFEIQHGKAKRGGRMIVEKLIFNNLAGSDSLPLYKLSSRSKMQIEKLENVNQYEERIWGPDSEYAKSYKRTTSESIEQGDYSIDISGCVEGLVLDRADYQTLESEEDPDFVAIDEIMKEIDRNYKIHIIQ